jgi:hypothetical protein
MKIIKCIIMVSIVGLAVSQESEVTITNYPMSAMRLDTKFNND